MNHATARRVLIGAALGLGVVASDAQATEGGGNSYPVGVETIFAGIMPPDGFHMFGYYMHYDATRLDDNSGNSDPHVASFKLRADVFATRLSWVWPGVRVFGATVETRTVFAVPTVELDLAVARPAPLGPIGLHGSTTGFGDVTFAPILFGWHDGAIHQTAGADSFLPVGTYNASKLVNAGRNYFQVAPFYAVTVLPDDKAQFDLKLRYGINGKNHDDDYRSGNEFTTEFSAGYRVHPDVLLGINGYLYRQTTDDRQNGVVVDGNGYRGRVNALGPFLGYSFSEKFTVLTKVQREFGARNRPEGTAVWLQTKVPF